MGGIAHPKFLAVKKLSENFFVKKFLFKNTKFGAKSPCWGNLWQNWFLVRDFSCLLEFYLKFAVPIPTYGTLAMYDAAGWYVHCSIPTHVSQGLLCPWMFCCSMKL